MPATDRPATLDHCLAAIRNAAAAPDEVIVVDAPAGGGPAHARNVGAQRTRADVLVFVDADVEAHPDAFARIRGALESDAGLAAVFGSYDDRPAAGGAVSGYRNLLHHHVHHTSAGPATTFWAGLGAVRREAFAAVGGFDERRYPRASIEDVELGDRLARRGERMLLDPAIQGRHLKAWTLRTMIETDLLRRGVPWVALLLRTHRAGTGLNLGWRHRFSVAAALAAVSAAAARRASVMIGAIVALIMLNRRFYALLLRRRGARETVLAVGVDIVHRLTAALSVPVGGVAFAAERLDRFRGN